MTETEEKGCIRCSGPNKFNYNYCPYCGRGLGKDQREKQKNDVDPLDLTPNFCPCCGEKFGEEGENDEQKKI